MQAARLVALHELVEVLALDRRLFEREVQVGAQVVDPELIGPGLYLAKFGPLSLRT
jgi:hypothetical protein